MLGPVHVRGSVSIPEAELRWRFSRSSGPGGQHVNTSDTRVELSFDVATSTALPAAWWWRAVRNLAGRLVGGVLTVSAQQHRSQLRNREAAADRLAELLAEATAPPARERRPTRPSRAARQRRMTQKRQRGAIKRMRSRPSDD